MLTTAFLRLRESARDALRCDQEGQGMVEYALVLMLIAIVVIVVLTTIGKRVNNIFSNVSSGLGA